MAVTLTTPLQSYVRTSSPPNPQSLGPWLDAELKKIQSCIAAQNAALKQLAAAA